VCVELEVNFTKRTSHWQKKQKKTTKNGFKKKKKKKNKTHRPCHFESTGQCNQACSFEQQGEPR
jgi:hypothetical protein